MSGNSRDESGACEYDRRKDVEEFEKSKAGVKRLVDSGITRIPRMFHHQPETYFHPRQDVADEDQSYAVPVVDMAGPHEEVVHRIQEAAAKYGFFQVVNHGVPDLVLDRIIMAMKAFHELPTEEKKQYYDLKWSISDKGIGFFSNYDIFHSKAANWRDTLQILIGPNHINPMNIPPVCREEVMEWGNEVKQFGERLMGLLSEGLGLSSDRLKGVPYMGRVSMGANYYPYCPELNKTVGFPAHTDPGIFTILLQDHVEGLQFKYNGKWIELKPVHGGLTVNIGDLFQIISNDQYKGGQHRVIANPYSEARVSNAVFFSPGIEDNLYGPLPELVSEDKPALYKPFKFSDLVTKFFTQEVGGKAMTSHFHL